jgi:hypothetical protein
LLFIDAPVFRVAGQKTGFPVACRVRSEPSGFAAEEGELPGFYPRFENREKFATG